MRGNLERVSEFFAIANASGSTPWWWRRLCRRRPQLNRHSRRSWRGEGKENPGATGRRQSAAKSPEAERSPEPNADGTHAKADAVRRDAVSHLGHGRTRGWFGVVEGRRACLGLDDAESREFEARGTVIRAARRGPLDRCAICGQRDRQYADLQGLRASGQVEQTKTLKCAECGSLNYPTEWYCERCGAEGTLQRCDRYAEVAWRGGSCVRAARRCDG